MEDSAQRALLSRRHFLCRSGSGLGALALGWMLAAEQARAESNTGFHHRPRARRVIQLFMNGGASQVDTYDYRPELAKRHGEQIDFGIKAAATSKPGAIMKSPFAWKQHGECGRWVSSVFEKTAAHVDEMAFLMAMTSPTNVHGPASYLQNTGFVLPGFPCMGAWISYALGTENANLPDFVVLPDPVGLPYNNKGNFSSGFLPARHQGVIARPDLPAPISHLSAPAFASHITPQSEDAGLKLLTQINRRHQAAHPGDSRLQARIASYELAARMQLAAPEVFDLSAETSQTHQAYGLDQETTRGFGRNCLVARRLVERGVRFVQVWSGQGGPKKNWDNHSDIQTELPYIAGQVDQPIAALLDDLKQRGLLEDTLVVWTTEFGRMPFTQGATGRDHNGGSFVSWLAGAGVKGGVAYGQSDEFGYQAAEDKTSGYDLHATILHLLGIDHERLVVRHNGIDRRLTDVHGRVVTQVLA